MSTITADKVIGKNLFSKGSVDVYNLPGGKVIRSIKAGSLIGNVYSYVEYNGNVYWQFIDNNKQPFYVKQDTNIDFPGLNDLLKKIQEDAVAKEIEKKGKLNYYLQKYLPWIVGGIVVAIVLPSIIKSTKK